MRIISIEVESFRGFGKRYKFELPEVDVLILHGPNGHGKTSFFDAIEWGITGKIFRYEDTSDERKRSRFIGNRFSEGAPYVSIVMADDTGNSILLTRVGTCSRKAATDYGKGSSSLEVVHMNKFYKDDDAESFLSKVLIREQWHQKVDLGRGLFVTHLLSQERMSFLLRGMKDKDRYDSVSLIFGTEHFNRSKELFQRVCNDLDNKRVRMEQDIAKVLGSIETLGNQISEKVATMGSLKASEGQALILNSYNTRLQTKFTLSELASEKFYLHLQNYRDYIIGREKECEKASNDNQIAEDTFKSWISFNQEGQRAKFLLKNASQYGEFLSQLEVLGWLKSRVKLFTVLDEQSQQLRDRKNELTKSIELKQQNIEQHISCITELDKLFNLTIKNKQFTQLNEFIKQHNFWHKKEVVDLVNELAIRDEEHQKALLGLTASKTQYLSSLEIANQIKSLDQNYRMFLRHLVEYIDGKTEINDCPACGTQGITTIHIKNFIEIKQAQNQPNLMNIETELMSLKLDLNRLENSAMSIGKTVGLLEGKIRQEFSKVKEYIHEQKKEVFDLTNSLNHVLKELDSLGALQVEFLAKLRQVEIPDNLDNYDYLLKEKEYTINQEALKVSKYLTEDEKKNIVKTIRDLNFKIENVEIRFNEFKRLFLLLGLPSTAIEKADEIDPNIVHDFLKARADLVLQQLNLLKEEKNLFIEVDQLLKTYRQQNDFNFLKEKMNTEENKLKVLKTKLLQVENDIAILKEVIQKIPVAIDRLNESVMDDLFETIQAIFTRINPHPIFKNIQYQKNQNYHANRLFLSVLSGDSTNEANPSFIFSAAQVNVVALSFFLAMAIQQKWSPLGIIALDDPVQNMDDLNVAALVDLLRSLAQLENGKNKQIIVSTHDVTFYQIMRKKFRFLKVGVIEYESFSERGPILKKTHQLYSRNNLDEVKLSEAIVPHATALVKIIQPLERDKLTKELPFVFQKKGSY